MTDRSAPKNRFSGRAPLVHGCRVLLLAAISLLINFSQQRESKSSLQDMQRVLTIKVVRQLDPRADSFGETSTSGTDVLDLSGQRIYRALMTSPAGDRQIGFSGPTNVLMLLDDSQQIRHLQILSSRDTREHVSQVKNHPSFLKSFTGQAPADLLSAATIDGVSGATLTSLAIAEAIRVRLGAMPAGGSLKFSEPPELERVQELFPHAASLDRPDKHSSIWVVRDSTGSEIGRLLRTSPAADNLVGYQGPTDTLAALKSDGTIEKIWVNRSYENEPYYHYLNEDWSFPSSLAGKSLPVLAASELDDLGIEGVSGATMTSQAVLKGVLAAARLEQQQSKSSAQQDLSNPSSDIHWRRRDLGTGIVALLGVILGVTRLRGRRRLRLGYQFLVIGYLGLTNGDLLSQAMLLGWAQSGIPWQRTLGLCLLTAASLLVPMGTGQNVYCSHICPHGAVQQLVKNRLPWKWTLTAKLHRVLRLLPGGLLAWCVLVVLLKLPCSLVDIEPFDAWVFRIAGWGTLTVAVVGLTVSLVIPLAYCRYGCPTGALLNFLRWHRRSDRLTAADGLAVLTFLAALIVLILKS